MKKKLLRLFYSSFIFCAMLYPSMVNALVVNEEVLCPNSGATPHASIMQGLKGINLYIEIASPYKEIFVCEKQIEKCIPPLNSQDNKSDADSSWSRFNEYPKQLYPAVLTEKFEKQIRAYWSPFIPHVGKCPEVRVLDLAHLDSVAREPHTLILIVTVDVDTEMTPHVVILSSRLYRADKVNVGPRGNHPHIQVIPLDLSKDKIANKVQYFVEHAVSVVQTNESSIP